MISISACSSTKQLEVINAPLDHVALNLPAVDVLTLDEIEWFIVTEENAIEVWAELAKEHFELVIMGVTDEGYESLTVNIAKLKQLILQQRAVISTYKGYYEEQTQNIINQEKEVQELKKDAIKKNKESSMFNLKSLFE